MRAIARALGGEFSSGAISAPGPGHSKHDRSLRVFIDSRARDGFRCMSFASDDWRLCRDHVKARLAGLPIDRSERPRRGSAPRESSSTQRALELWTAARPVRNTIAEIYLASRGLATSIGATALRFHPRCPFRLEDGEMAHPPALIGLFRDISSDEPCGVHRTALKADGTGKCEHPGLSNPKKMLGRAKGAAIKLNSDGDVTTGLGIAEGIETALAILSARWQPVWALGSAGAIADFPVVDGVEALSIFADADQTGMSAARACQARWLRAGCECRIITPRQSGADWNDIGRAA